MAVKKYKIVSKLRLARSILLAIFLAGCVEPYEFAVRDVPRGIAVEAYFSDKSFNETLSYPSDGRYFTVRLSYTSSVENTRSEKVTGALVELQDDRGGSYTYVENVPTGVYFIPDRDFKALPDVKYRLRVLLPGEAEIESGWQTLPAEGQPIGTVGFKEIQKQVYKYEAGERVVRTVDGVETRIAVAENSGEEPVYYRWSAEPVYIFESPFASSASFVKRCWVKDSLYLANYTLREDHKGGYDQPLFFMESVRNYKIYHEISVLIRQEVLNKEHFFFWKEMQERNQGGFTQDTPPYNLKTNLTVTNGDVKVYGYFAPVREQATRWYFGRKDLSYFVEDTTQEDCNSSKMLPAPHCSNCLQWEPGKVTNQEPSWWRKG